ncbi:cytochrome P450 [Chloroflexota bacterium]
MKPEPPVPSGFVGLQALQAIVQQKNILAALSVFHQEMGDVFRLGLPGFRPIMLVGPEANRFFLIDQRKHLRWRFEQDPVAKLLGHGILVEDGDLHDSVRRRMNPALHRKMLDTYVSEMVCCTDEVMESWAGDSPLDMLVEMRRVALLILVHTMFRVDFMPEIDRLWQPILKLLDYISPGMWLIWPGVPRPGYKRAWQQLDEYLYRIIRTRRENVGEANDLLGLLVTTPDLSDELIRDQLLTMLIAGHDTSTALLAWVWYLLGSHPEAMSQAQAEVDTVLGSEAPTPAHVSQLCYLEQVVKETLRLYPPIHLGTRMATTDLEFQGYRIPAGQRVLYSIYLSHRHPKYWSYPEQFDPDRFTPEREKALPPFLYVPFGGGARICLGFLFSQIEAKVVLARILQNFTLELADERVCPRMGATLEPNPGVMMQVNRL